VEFLSIFREETEVLDRMDEIKMLRARGHIQSYSLTIHQESVECTAIVPVRSFHFRRSRLLLHSRDVGAENYITLTMVFQRPSGAPIPAKFSVVYSSMLETMLGSHAPKAWKRLSFQDMFSFVSEARKEVILQIRQLEQQWEERSTFILDVYSAYENMVGSFQGCGSLSVVISVAGSGIRIWIRVLKFHFIFEERVNKTIFLNFFVQSF
jgi:hypothetical protein